MGGIPLDSQSDFWNRAVEEKDFCHPVDFERLARYAGPESRVLEVGCGWGRVLGLLHERGYRNLSGVDPARAMVERANREYPHLDVGLLDGPRLPFEDRSFDLVLLFAVLTCIPADSALEELLGEIERVLSPGGILYVSDLFLQDDERNRRRYGEYLARYGCYGIFRVPGGAVLRHLEQSRFEALVAGFHRLELRRFGTRTMNGNPVTAFQYFGRRE